eukprot:Tbor_TRINITY_DN5699_c0_g1::TRINITY_DN5699_c0_g1_i4::g.8773::m.8773
MSSAREKKTPNVVQAGYVVNRSPDTYDATVTFRFDPPKNGTITEEKLLIKDIFPGLEKKIPELPYSSGNATLRATVHRVEAAKKGGNSKASVSSPFDVTGVSLDHTFYIDYNGTIKQRH